MERYCGIVKEQLKYHTLWQLLISMGLLMFSPLILGIRNLDTMQSAKVLEMYVALIGIVLFVPVFQPEQNREIRDLIASKYTSILSIYSVRVILMALFLGILLFIYMEVMRQGNCEMPMGKYFFGVLAEIFAFGGLGILAYAVSDNLIIGYMAPVIYYVLSYGGGSKYLGKLYPFAMTTDYETKYVLFAAGIICMIAGVVVRGKRQR